MDNLVSILVFTPLLAALILTVFLRGDDEAAQRNAKWLAVTATGSTFFVALILLFAFDPALDLAQFLEERTWPLGLNYRVGIDGISLPFLIGITAIMPLAVLASWTIETRVRDYIIALLVAESLLLAAVASLDLAFFVVFFEAALLPIALLAGRWGRAGAGLVALKAVIYAVPGTILLIIAAMAMAQDAATTDMGALLLHNLPTSQIEVFEIEVPGGTQTLILIGLVWTVAVKAGLWPFQGWLVEVVAKAPAAIVIVLTALLTKLALYAVLRIALPMLPIANELSLTGALSVLLIGGLLLALAALNQETLRGTLGYMSGAIMSLIVAGALTGEVQGVDGAVIAMLSHSLLFAGLGFALLTLETRLRTDDYEMMGGVRLRLPALAAAMLLFVAAAFGMPLTAGFVGVILGLYGIFTAKVWAGLGAALVLLTITAAAFSIYRRVALGDAMRESVRTIAPLNAREGIALGLAAFGLILLGLFPSVILDRTGPAAQALAVQYSAAQE